MAMSEATKLKKQYQKTCVDAEVAYNAMNIAINAYTVACSKRAVAKDRFEHAELLETAMELRSTKSED